MGQTFLVETDGHVVAPNSYRLLWREEFRVSGFGFRVWGLGFGVWGLGFRVSGFGFGLWERRAVVIQRPLRVRLLRPLNLELRDWEPAVEGLAVVVVPRPEQLDGDGGEGHRPRRQLRPVSESHEGHGLGHDGVETREGVRPHLVYALDLRCQLPSPLPTKPGRRKLTEKFKGLGITRAPKQSESLKRHVVGHHEPNPTWFRCWG